MVRWVPWLFENLRWLALRRRHGGVVANHSPERPWGCVTESGVDARVVKTLGASIIRGSLNYVKFDVVLFQHLLDFGRGILIGKKVIGLSNVAESDHGVPAKFGVVSRKQNGL